MAATFINFTPSATSPFTFQPVFDGTAYSCIVRWNLAGQRYYVECFTLGGALVFNVPMIGSPLATEVGPGVDPNISLTAGYFTTMLIWRVANNQFEII